VPLFFSAQTFTRLQYAPDFRYTTIRYMPSTVLDPQHGYPTHSYD
jgi:hypothetical protein